MEKNRKIKQYSKKWKLKSLNLNSLKNLKIWKFWKIEKSGSLKKFEEFEKFENLENWKLKFCKIESKNCLKKQQFGKWISYKDCLQRLR